MIVFKRHLINTGSSIKLAVELLNKLSPDPILFVIDRDDKLIGSITDGDIRRGLLKNITLSSKVSSIIQPNPCYIRKGENDIQKVISYREGLIRILPVVDDEMRVVDLINFRINRSYLPIDAIIMAGGRGQRLLPLTETTPKPLLKVAGKPIIEYNIDRLAYYGIRDFWVSLNYLGDQIQQYFGNGNIKSVNIEYVRESKPLGTIGAVSLVNFKHDYILITNSDLLTNIDFEWFFLEFIKTSADIAVLTIPYNVSIPYAVLEADDGVIRKLKEKPTYTYQSNGGVYLMKREILGHVPKDTFYNATDLIESLIRRDYKVISIPFSGYWLDIGRHEDFEKAQSDFRNIIF